MARVLIVEDEYPLRRVLTLNLARRGHTVIEADSVASADEALAASDVPFDLIVLDINLPDQTGWDVLRHLETSPPTPSPARRGGASEALSPSESGFPVADEEQGRASGSPLPRPGEGLGGWAVSRPPVIVMTAVSPNQRRLREFRPTAVLVKPFPIGALLRLIERVLSEPPAQEAQEAQEARDAADLLRSYEV